MHLSGKLLRFDPDLKYIVYDTETESLNLRYSRPWEIAFSVIEKGKIVAEYQKFPRLDDFAISKGAAEITRFSMDNYRSKWEDPNQVLDLFESYLYNPEYRVVGLNLFGFDIYQIANLQKYCGRKVDFSYLARTYDCVCLGRAYKMNIPFPKEKSEIPGWMFKMLDTRVKGVKASLKSMAKDLDVPYNEGQHHEGSYDCVVTDGIFRKFVQMLEIH